MIANTRVLMDNREGACFIGPFVRIILFKPKSVLYQLIWLFPTLLFLCPAVDIRNKSELPMTPIVSSMLCLTRYHLGTVAKGSFIITLVEIPRLILTYIHNQLKGKVRPLSHSAQSPTSTIGSKAEYVGCPRTALECWEKQGSSKGFNEMNVKT